LNDTDNSRSDEIVALLIVANVIYVAVFEQH